MIATTITADIAEALIADGWTLRWAGTPNHLADEHGNTVAIYVTTDDPEETLKIEFEYAIPGGAVEVLHLAMAHGAQRIAAIIAALAMPL